MEHHIYLKRLFRQSQRKAKPEATSFVADWLQRLVRLSIALTVPVLRVPLLHSTGDGRGDSPRIENGSVVELYLKARPISRISG